MKKYLLFSLLAISGTACTPKDRFVKVVNESLKKTVMIEVATVIDKSTIEVKDPVVFINVATATVHYLGAGVFISPNGHVLTCAHLFNEGDIQAITVTDYEGYSYGAEILEKDESKDLALIKIYDLSPHYAKLANPLTLQVGQEVIAVGNPLALSFSVTHGILSALNRDFPDRYDVTQSDCFINPGNSGGPLFNLQGELVGINSFILPPLPLPIFTGCGFSVSPGQMIEFLTRIRAKYDGLPKFKIFYWVFHSKNFLRTK